MEGGGRGERVVSGPRGELSAGSNTSHTTHGRHMSDGQTARDAPPPPAAACGRSPPRPCVPDSITTNHAMKPGTTSYQLFS